MLPLLQYRRQYLAILSTTKIKIIKNPYLVWDLRSSADCVPILGILSSDVTEEESLPILLGFLRLFLYGHLVSGSCCSSFSMSSLIRSLLDSNLEVLRLNGLVTVASCKHHTST